MFFILRESRDGGTTWEDRHDFRYNNGQEAAEAARRMNEHYRMYAGLFSNKPTGDAYAKMRYRVRQVVDTDPDNYIAREAKKGHDYIDLKAIDKYAEVRPHWLAHWHPDPEQKFKIRFFRTEADAARERYTFTNASRFLLNYAEIQENIVEDYLVSRGYYDGCQFAILTEADDIVSAYENGPSSCMNDPEEYSLPDPHPASVYAAGDLALAVIRRDGEVTARGLIWPAKKIYCSIYGHEKLLVKHLTELGYRRTFAQSAWRGARLKKVWDADREAYLCPFIDISSTVSVGRDGFLRLAAQRGSWECKETSGYTYRYDDSW